MRERDSNREYVHSAERRSFTPSSAAAAGHALIAHPWKRKSELEPTCDPVVRRRSRNMAQRRSRAQDSAHHQQQQSSRDSKQSCRTQAHTWGQGKTTVSIRRTNTSDCSLLSCRRLVVKLCILKRFDMIQSGPVYHSTVGNEHRQSAVVCRRRFVLGFDSAAWRFGVRRRFGETGGCRNAKRISKEDRKLT